MAGPPGKSVAYLDGITTVMPGTVLHKAYVFFAEGPRPQAFFVQSIKDMSHDFEIGLLAVTTDMVAPPQFPLL